MWQLAVPPVFNFQFHNNGNDIGYFQAKRDILARLAFLAGEHSRFRQDPAMTNM
jgi:hypothetical protein